MLEGWEATIISYSIFAAILNCDMIKTQFKYLGMLVGGYHLRSKFWERVVERVRNRLGRWKGKFISMA